MATNAAQSTPDTTDASESTDIEAQAAAAEAEDQATFKEFAQLVDGKSEDSDDSQTPAPEPDPETPEPTASEDPAPEPAPEPSVWDGLSAEQQQALADLQREKAKAEHAFESNRHRLSAYHRKLNAAEAELQQLQAQAPQAAPPPAPVAPAAPSQPAQQARTEESQSVDLSQFKEDFPEVFAAMTAYQQQEIAQLRQGFQQELRTVKQQVGEVAQPLQQMNDDREAQYRQSQRSALAAAHPDWSDIEADTTFWQWLDMQSDGMKALANSTAAEDNIMLIDRYKQMTKAAQADPDPQPSRQPTPPAPRRPREPSASEQLPRAGTSRPSATPDAGDDSAMWDYWAKQADTNRI